MSVMEINSLTKRYGNGRGIMNLSLSIEKGQVYGLLGPNGSGKTTTMKAMTGMLHPDSGQISILGRSLDGKDRPMDRVGSIIENPGFYPYLTARQNLEIVSRLYPGCAQMTIDGVLDMLGLARHQKDKAGKFSQGMKQRLGLAMALLPNPELLILDEPTNGLDIEGMAQIRGVLSGLAAEGRTILISSHLAGEVEQICTDVAVIREGMLLATANVPQIMDEYGSVENYYLTLVNHKEMAS